MLFTNMEVYYKINKEVVSITVRMQEFGVVRGGMFSISLLDFFMKKGSFCFIKIFPEMCER